jgi:peptidoglycan/LPS O-acetylase OafA/YrhL
MNTRSLPRISGQSALDIDARRIRDRAAREAAETGRQTSAASAASGRLTWLGDMLTADKNSFGVMRLAMALAVLVSHAVFLTTNNVKLEPLFTWTGYTLGQHGVQVFFFLSGILVAQSLFQSRSVKDYTLARALRIFPALAVCVLLTAMVLGPLLSDLPALLYMREKWTASYIIKTMSLSTGSAELPGLFQNNPVPRAVNTSIWTLKYEVLCYVILAGIGMLLLRVKAWRQAAWIIAFAWMMFAIAIPSGISAESGGRTMLQVLHYFTIFFGAGVVAYAARHWIPVHAALLLPLGAMLWMAIGTRYAVPAMAVFFGYASIWLATFTFGPLRAITNSNDYSYATYLYHFPVAQAVLHFAPDMHVVPLIGITAGIVLPLAFLSWELVERPALALRHKWQRLAEAPAAATMTVAPKADVTAQTQTSPARTPTTDLFEATLAAQRREMALSPTHATATVPSPVLTEPELAQSMPASVAADETATQAARAWRPMPTRRTLSVMPEAPLISAKATALDPLRQTPRDPAASPAPTSSWLRAKSPAAPPLQPTKSRAFSVRKPVAPPADLEPAPAAIISQSRMAMATKRHTPPPVEPAASPTPREPSRAVVAIDNDGPLTRLATPSRVQWQRSSRQPA